jgi:hypothetical protein
LLSKNATSSLGWLSLKLQTTVKKKMSKLLKHFGLDIDCGESKAEVNPKTGRPDGYIDQATGLQKLKDFCDTSWTAQTTFSQLRSGASMPTGL